MLYRLHEADMVVPDGWLDRSINTFLLPAGAHGGAMSFVVIRDYNTPNADLTTYTDQQLIETSKKLPSYKYISRKGISISGQPAVQADYTWRTPEGVAVYQRQAVVKLARCFLVLTFTSQQQDMPKVDLYWQQAMQSIRLLPQEVAVRG